MKRGIKTLKITQLHTCFQFCAERRAIVMKSTILATIALFAYVFVFEWVFHGMILADMYQATADIWRTEEEMMSKMGWMIGGQFLMAVFLVQIFQYLETGFTKVGALLGALYGSGQLVMYSVAPYPMLLIASWIAGGIVEYAVAGLLYCCVVRPESCSSKNQ